jgi:hypothetical protein
MATCEMNKKSLVSKPEGKKLFSIPRCRWKNNIKIDVKYIP